MRRVAVLDLGIGNLHSVAKALAAAGADVALVSAPFDAGAYDGLCVPGQGIFSVCVDRLTSTGGDDMVRNWISSGKPYLGICLGMQVLFEASDEGNPNSALGEMESQYRPRRSRATAGSTGREGLGVIRGRVTRLPSHVTVPHMGWNTVVGLNGPAEHYYFDHSFACHPTEESIVHGWCEHGRRFAAWIRQGSLSAVQFHPEKSGRAGIDLLTSWVKG